MHEGQGLTESDGTVRADARTTLPSGPSDERLGLTASQTVKLLRQVWAISGAAGIHGQLADIWNDFRHYN